MTLDDMTLIIAIALWIGLFAITLWIGVPRQGE